MPPFQTSSRATDDDASSPFYRYRFANVDYDESRGVLRVAGAVVDVEPRPVALLAELLRRPNEVISREELLSLLWEGRPTVQNVLANAVAKLRKALGEEGGACIVNVPRTGYRFAGALERVAVGQHEGVDAVLVAGEPVPGQAAWRLEKRLGKTAASLVWLASERKGTGQRVFKFATDSERLTALKREWTLYRVLAAELPDRADFARVVAANFATAPYWIECEHGGDDLLDWAAAGHLAALARPARIALFLQIARAVSAAHGVGVLHKDLKPANVLIARDGDGWSARLTDFGSSRLLEPGRLAALGVTALGLTLTQGVGSDAFRGTPLYLAPELLAGQSPTTQSDLYALGLLLYQMLVADLQRPLATGWQRDIGDDLLVLDVAAATEGRPQDRLRSVAELAERLESLASRRAEGLRQAEAARRMAGVAADAQRRRARRPWVVAAFAALSVGLVASLGFYRQSHVALLAAQQESARAQAFNDFLTKDFLQSRDVLRASANKPTSLLEALRAAAPQIATRFKGQPLVEAAVRYQLSRTYLRLASTTEANREMAAALALAAPRLAADDPFILTLRFGDADLLMRTMEPGDLELAKVQLHDAMQAMAGHEPRAASDIAFLSARENFELQRRIGQDRAALAPGLQMVSLAESTPGIDEETRFEARQSLAELYFVLGDLPQGQAVLKDALNARPDADHVAEVAHARATLAIASVDYEAGHIDPAEKELRTLAERLRHTLGTDDLQFGMTMNALARLEAQRGDADPAQQALAEARASFTAALGPEHQYVNVTAVNLADQWVLLGRCAQALQLTDSLEPWFAAHTTHRFMQLAHVHVAALNGVGRAAEALAMLDLLTPEQLASDENLRWQFDAERGLALRRLGQAAQGHALLAAAVAAGEKQASDEWSLRRYRRLLDTPVAARR